MQNQDKSKRDFIFSQKLFEKNSWRAQFWSIFVRISSSRHIEYFELKSPLFKAYLKEKKYDFVNKLRNLSGELRLFFESR